MFGFLGLPHSLRAAYLTDVEPRLRSPGGPAIVLESDLAHLPVPVQRYLTRAGVVGQLRVRNVHACVHGRIRGGRDARWMPLVAEQYNFFDDPARLFYLRASMFGIPVQGYHRYVGPSATMTIRAAGLMTIVDASGPAMDEGETVTMFNDMCVLAPATLIDPAIAWEAVDAHTARATFRNAGYAVRAELSFNEAGELCNFTSDDRYQLSPDGRSAKKVRWSTPVGAYRPFGSMNLASKGEGRWHEREGEYSYIELAIDHVRYNVPAR